MSAAERAIAPCDVGPPIEYTAPFGELRPLSMEVRKSGLVRLQPWFQPDAEVLHRRGASQILDKIVPGALHHIGCVQIVVIPIREVDEIIGFICPGQRRDQQ